MLYAVGNERDADKYCITVYVNFEIVPKEGAVGSNRMGDQKPMSGFV